MVFNQEKVQRLDITISSDNWSAMQADLESIFGEISTQRPGLPPLKSETASSLINSDPIWVDCSVKQDGIEWYHVGIRYKGNSSLQSAYQAGNNKLSLKLDFDEFEDDFSGMTDQRFYGFKQLNLNNNFDDASLMREKVGADLFREFGLASAQTSFCEVYIDNGSGPEYYGLYTIVEEVDNTVIKTQFANDSGNIYKPDGDAASFASGTFNTEEFYLKNNEDIADYSDVEALYNIINSSLRTSNTEVWKDSLEKVLDVDIFLKWLAVNTTIQNWDTYANMTHNYYLYNNPENNLLTWIPWDNNEAFQFGKQSGAVSLELSEVTDSWPLISYLIEQDEYKTIYNNYLSKFIEDVFNSENMVPLYTKYYDLLKDYAYAEQSGYTFINNDTDFDNAVETLKTHVQTRNDAVNSYLK